jgi:hypothetical protein
MAEPGDEDGLNHAVERLEQRLAEAGASGVSPFTPQAYDLLRRRVAEYIDELVDEAIRVAKRRPSSDVVSTADVNRASEHLGTRPRSRRGQIIGSVGSLLLGAALGNALQIAGQAQTTPESALLTFGVGAVGAAMTVFGFVRD